MTDLRKKIIWVIAVVGIVPVLVMPGDNRAQNAAGSPKTTQVDKANSVDTLICRDREEAEDELSMLWENQNSEADACLFVGCSGFF